MIVSLYVPLGEADYAYFIKLIVNDILHLAPLYGNNTKYGPSYTELGISYGSLVVYNYDGDKGVIDTVTGSVVVKILLGRWKHARF